MAELAERTDEDCEGAISERQRRRWMRGEFATGEDVVALRRFVRRTQAQFARAMGIGVHTLRNGEQNRRKPEGPAIALVRIAAPHPRISRVGGAGFR